MTTGQPCSTQTMDFDNTAAELVTKLALRARRKRKRLAAKKRRVRDRLRLLA